MIRSPRHIPSRGVRWGKWFAVIFLLAAVPGLPAVGAKGDPEANGRKNPKILLTASPAFGFTPLSVQLVATLNGVSSRDPNFCHAGVTWIRIDPGTAPESGTRVREDPKCVHGEEELSVATTFSKTFELDLPGTYLYRIIVEGKDGTQVKSNFVNVRVLRVP